MRFKISELNGGKLFPSTRKFGNRTFNLDKVSKDGAKNHHSYYYYATLDHLSVNIAKPVLVYKMQGSVPIDKVNALREGLAGFDTKIRAQYSWDSASDTSTDLNWEKAGQPKIHSAYVTISVTIPFTEAQTAALNAAIQARKDKTAKDKAIAAAKKAAAKKAEAKLKFISDGVNSDIIDVAEALMVLKKAGLKVVTVEEKKK